MAMTKRPGRLTRALLETAEDMRRVGVIGAAALAKITSRHRRDTAGGGKAWLPGRTCWNSPQKYDKV